MASQVRKVCYTSASRHELVGVLEGPDVLETEGNGVVVLVHGGMAHKDSLYHKSLAQQVSPCSY